MVYVCESMKRFVTGNILSFMEKANAKRYMFTHTVINDDGFNATFKIVCDAPKVSTSGKGITMKVDNTSIITGSFKNEQNNMTYPYGSMFTVTRDNMQFGVTDTEGNKHWYSYIPIRY